MGHTEMLLAVAGFDENEIAEHTARLAGGDWSSFPSHEQVAFAFVHKHALTPWAIDDEDVAQLVKQFGTERALDIVWYSARCHYMTRVADAFQLALERDNVFQALAQPDEPE